MLTERELKISVIEIVSGESTLPLPKQQDPSAFQTPSLQNGQEKVQASGAKHAYKQVSPLKETSLDIWCPNFVLPLIKVQETHFLD